METLNYYTLAKIAELYRVSLLQILDWIRDQSIAAVKIRLDNGMAQVLVPADELSKIEELMKEGIRNEQ